MERLSATLAEATRVLAAAPRRVAWALRRAGHAVVRRVGWAGLALAAGGVVVWVAGWVREHQAGRLAHAQQQVLIQQAQPVVRVLQGALGGVNGAGSEGRARLAEFDAYLPSHDGIPTALADLFTLAQREGLSIARGEYKAQADGPGRFMRYRMTLPVQGDAAAIRRFMLAALQAHKTLALESVQFKRERPATAEVEARIQWVLLTRLPGARGDAAPLASAGAARVPE